MNLLLPLDGDDVQGAKLSSLNGVQFWAVVTIEKGRVVETVCHKQREDSEATIDAVVVKDKDEYVWPFVEEQIPVLVASTQQSVDDIVEAFLFKELFELS